MGKLFGNKPSYYFDIEEKHVELAIDLACASAHWEDENQKYKESKETANKEAGSIGEVLSKINEESQGRG